MKKVLYVAVALILAFALPACGGNNNSLSNPREVEEQDISSSNEQRGTTDEASDENSQDAATDNDSIEDSNQDAITDNESVEDVRIKLTFDNEEVIVRMYDNPTSRDFLRKLPLTLTFKDYGGFEKLSVFEEGLSTEDMPSDIIPSIGDFGYFSPWKAVNMYYTDWHEFPGLILLGKIETGLEEFAEKLAGMNEEFEVTIEMMD